MSQKSKIILGLLRGDQGKGKIVDFYSNDYDIIVRFQGGPNAGHTIYRNDTKIVLHQIPSGILNNKICLIGHGCIVDIVKLIKQIDSIAQFVTIDQIKTNLKISKGAHVITTAHIEQDTNRQNAGKGNGSTKCGISPCYRDKYYRQGIRLVDWFKTINSDDKLKNQLLKKLTAKEQEYDHYVQIIDVIESALIDDTYYMNYVWVNKRKLFEGAQGVFLDIDSPYYPNVSSSSVGVGGAIIGTGISFEQMRDVDVTGVVKSYMSSVGNGYFPTQIKDKFTSVDPQGNPFQITAEQIRKVGNEYGATTGRPRNVGLLDLAMVKHACDTIGVTQLAITRIDTLMEIFPYEKYKYIPVCVQYGRKTQSGITADSNYSWYDVVSENLVPIYVWVKNWQSVNDQSFKNFIKLIERTVYVPVELYSYGKQRDSVRSAHNGPIPCE